MKCSARTWQQAGERVAVQPAHGAETASVANPVERAVSGRNIPPESPVPHASASSFCSETTFLPTLVKNSDGELMSLRATRKKQFETKKAHHICGHLCLMQYVSNFLLST